MKEMLSKEIGTDIRQLEFKVEIKRIFKGMSQTLSQLGHLQSKAVYGSTFPYFKPLSASICPLCKEKLTSHLTFNVELPPCLGCLREL